MKDLKLKLQEYIDNNLEVETERFGLFRGAARSVAYDYLEESSSIDDYINKHSDYNDFQTLLFELIDKRNLKDSDVYNKVNIDRRLFSKIRSDKNYHPSKETVILLAISLELSEKELDNLLDSASYSLPKNNKFDLIIRFCFINKIFNLNTINEFLYDHNCKVLNN